MIPTELFDKTVLHQTYLLRRSNGITRDVVNLLIEAERDIKAQLINTDLTKYQDARLKNLLSDVKKRINTVTDDISKTILPEFKDLAVYESGHQAATLGSVVTAPIEAAATTTLIASVTESPIQGKFFGGWMDTLNASTVARLNQSIRIGVLEGETLNQMSARIRSDFKTTRNAAEQLVRTGTNSVTNNARQLLWAQNSDIVEEWEFVATLDYRTTLICQSLDGKVFPVGEGPRPPRHRNCRSTTVAVVKDPMFNETTRSSLNGQVDAKLTYPQWLKTQPAAAQKEVLGADRYKLWKDGRLKIDQFTDKTGRTLTLKELEAKGV